MDTEWMSVGKCRDLSPTIFFPSDGVGVQAAQRICAECPVADQCLQYALDERVDHGVWGCMRTSTVVAGSATRSPSDH